MDADYWWDVLEVGAVLVRMNAMQGTAVFQQGETEVTVDLFDDTAVVRQISTV